MKIAVAGGTGVVGRHVVEVARAGGHEPVVLSRSAGVDLLDEGAVQTALGGADVVIDVANVATLSAKRATGFFTEATGRLSRLGAAAGASRLLVLSIVAIDRVNWTYYRAKLAQEKAARSGPLPLTIVRATQFHEFPGQLLARMSLGPLSFLPVMTVQPIAARSVAEFLVSSAVQPPAEEMVEIAGPEPEELVALARATLHRQGRRGVVVPLRVPGAAGRAMRRGELRPGPGAQLLGPTFADWSAEQPSPRPGGHDAEL
jgi:uncharacterized protein YbjT (DUF2867 family)